MSGVVVPHPLSPQSSPRQLAVELFDVLAEKTSDGVGITRECYAQGEELALGVFKDVAEQHGLVTTSDAIGNMIVSLPDDDGQAPAFLIGSHTDSVPQGGNFDGAAGVVAGLLCLIRLAQNERRPALPVRLIILRGEESAFYGRANIGSRALFGLIDEKDLAAKRRGNGRSLADAMAAAGVPVDRVARRQRFFEPEQALGFLELHIEQGPVMLARDLPTAIVTGIRGNIRHRRIVCRGEAGHSGTVPRWLRKDAVFALADLLMRIDEHWQRLMERGLDLVVTTGIVATNPDQHAMSRIPGEVAFSFEMRSQSHDTLEAFYELFRSECRAVSTQRGVSFAFDDRVYTEPARMSDGIIKRLRDASEKLGLAPELIPSGAGHDAAVFANEGVPSGMIFVRNAHGSHNPKETMDIDDFMRAVDLMYSAVAEAQ